MSNFANRLQNAALTRSMRYHNLPDTDYETAEATRRRKDAEWARDLCKRSGEIMKASDEGSEIMECCYVMETPAVLTGQSWNANFSEAPKADKILVWLGLEGGKVVLSYWIVDENKWVGEPEAKPLAWQFFVVPKFHA